MRTIKIDEGCYEVVEKGIVIGYVEKRFNRWYGYSKCNRVSDFITATTKRECVVKVLRESKEIRI